MAIIQSGLGAIIETRVNNGKLSLTSNPLSEMVPVALPNPPPLINCSVSPLVILGFTSLSLNTVILPVSAIFSIP